MATYLQNVPIFQISVLLYLPMNTQSPVLKNDTVDLNLLPLPSRPTLSVVYLTQPMIGPLLYPSYSKQTICYIRTNYILKMPESWAFLLNEAARWSAIKQAMNVMPEKCAIRVGMKPKISEFVPKFFCLYPVHHVYAVGWIVCGVYVMIKARWPKKTLSKYILTESIATLNLLELTNQQTASKRCNNGYTVELQRE